MMVRLFALLAVCASLCYVEAAVSRAIQTNPGGVCTYQNATIEPKGELLPVYNPEENSECARIVCASYEGDQSLMTVMTCGIMIELDGKQAQKWPGKQYPECCRKPPA